ncbi:hypothetical protein GCM10009122_43280 [Fulvivirga kasyanovii]
MPFGYSLFLIIPGLAGTSSFEITLTLEHESTPSVISNNKLPDVKFELKLSFTELEVELPEIDNPEPDSMDHFKVGELKPP